MVKQEAVAALRPEGAKGDGSYGNMGRVVSCGIGSMR